MVFIGVLKVLLKNLHQWQQFGNFLRIGWWPVSFTTTSKLLHGRGHIIIRSAMNWKKEDRRPKQQLTHFFYLAWDRWQIIPMAILRAFILHGHQIGKLESFFTQTMLSKHTDLHLKSSLFINLRWAEDIDQGIYVVVICDLRFWRRKFCKHFHSFWRKRICARLASLSGNWKRDFGYAVSLGIEASKIH